MNYMLLIWGDPNSVPEADQDAMMAEYFAFTKSIVDSGEMVAGDPLDLATWRVRVRDGQTVVTDGPFAETKEVLGGYYIVNVDSTDRAHELAAQIPGAKHGWIEVRPLIEIPAEMRG